MVTKIYGVNNLSALFKSKKEAKKFEMENDVPEYSFSSKYNKLIEKDFELADKISDVERLIKNVKAQISRREK